MNYSKGRDIYTLASGRTFYANHGILGISPGEGAAELTEGYDGGLFLRSLTREERIEIATAMVEAWGKWLADGE